jgi:S-adenosylmethionine:tRNA ribosyltransferase-isomerase
VSKSQLKLSDFDYELPQELIAQYPAPSRESSRMLVLNRGTGEIVHADFRHIASFMEPRDVLVLNNTKVINARLFGRKRTGGKIEIFLLETAGEDEYKALIRPSDRIKEGDQITFDGSELKAYIIKKKAGGSLVRFSSQWGNIDDLLKKTGNVPLPPYIKRSTEKLDSERYQTVYAEKEGATASPTAGLHFTKEILEEIKKKGIKVVYVTLHVNYGTFAPVRVEDIEDHKMHSESFELIQKAADEINSVKANGGRVFAVGTTSCRVLETCARQVTRSPGHQVTRYKLEAKKGKTDLFIYPAYKFKIVDALLTNFHFPKSTLLMLVSAFAGKDLIFKAYEEAIARKYRFFSYGDCMLII